MELHDFSPTICRALVFQDCILVMQPARPSRFVVRVGVAADVAIMLATVLPVH